MAVYSEVQMPRFKEEDLPGTTKKLYNVVRELQEMLQFVLSNLDGDNIEGYEEIFNRLEGADGAISILKQTADEITAQVRKGTEQIAELTVKADGITQRVTDTEKGIAELKVTADGISQRVADNEGNLSSLQQTANGLASRVSDAEGNITSLELRAGETALQMYRMNESVTEITVTADGLTSTVSNLNNKYTEIKQTVDEISLTGVVTFHDLATPGQTKIDGENITTGQISLDRLDLSNNYGYITLGRGSTGSESTRGLLLCGPEISGSPAQYRNHFYASNAAARMTGEDLHGGESIYTYPDGIDATTSISVTSDERLKNNISYDLAERYADFYRALRPARYHMNSSRSGRVHTGFIAQQMRDALLANGLDTQDLAALVQKGYDAEAEDGGDGLYSIRYSELIALNTAMVQSLLARVDALESRLQAQEGGENETGESV